MENTFLLHKNLSFCYMKYGLFIALTVALIAMMIGILFLNVYQKQKIEKRKTECRQVKEKTKSDVGPGTDLASDEIKIQETNNFTKTNKLKRKREPGFEESIFLSRSQNE